MKKYFLVGTALIIIFCSASCRKDGTPVCKAGQGGNATLLVFPQHHGHPIVGATAYVAYGTLVYPGALSSFNLVVAGEPAEEHIHVDGMNCGDYFIYCVGYDSTISQTVRGGLPFSLSPLQTGEVNVYVPVTE
jgi:hypothetical protein